MSSSTQFKVDLEPQTHEAMKAACRTLGMPHKIVTERLLRWFLALPADMQYGLVSPLGPTTMAALARSVLAQWESGSLLPKPERIADNLSAKPASKSAAPPAKPSRRSSGHASTPTL